MKEEKIIIGANTKYPLNGRLTLPDEITEGIPAVVLVHGSGPSDMDETIGKNRPFKDLAEGLAEKGIAILRYDKRTFVYGKEMKGNPSMSVKEETVEDAILAADFLRGDSRIAGNKIFLIGHSFGGMMAPRIDAEGGNFAGLVMMAGSPHRLEEIIMGQNQDVLKSVNRFLQWIIKKQMASLSAKLEKIYSLTAEEAKSMQIFGKHMRAFYFKEMGEYPSNDYLRELEKPILILQGEKDFQATVERDFEGYQKLLAGKRNVTFKLYPNLNHLFMPSVHGNILKAKKEYQVAQKVDPEVIKDIATWIHSL